MRVLIIGDDCFSNGKLFNVTMEKLHRKYHITKLIIKVTGVLGSLAVKWAGEFNIGINTAGRIDPAITIAFGSNINAPVIQIKEN